MESYANSIEDKLVDSLQFKLNPGASYIIDRKSVTYHPQGSNVYSPTQGTKLIKIQLTGKDWLDPETFRVCFDLVNTSTARVQDGEVFPKLRLLPISSPWAFFRRLRILIGGVVCEDIDYYNRVHEMFSILTSKHSRINETAEGFGEKWDIYIELIIKIII